MNNAYEFISIIVGVLAFLGAVGGLMRWFYLRGAQESRIVTALDRNSESNDAVAKELRDFKGETLATLRDYGWRLTILEDKTKAYEDSNAS